MSLLNLLSSALGVNMNGLPQQGFGMRGAPLIGQKFSQKYHAYSPAYWNSENRDKLEQGDKIVIPASALEQLSRLNIQFPIMFCITHDSEILPKKSHCSVLEFTAPEGEVYLPLWMIDNLGLDPMGNSMVLLETVRLQKGQFVQFQAHETKFAMLPNPKVVLEKALRSYSCLTVGDTIQVNFADYVYKLDVTDVKPKTNRPGVPDAISIIETDIKVDFLEPRDYKEWEKKNKESQMRNKKFVESKDNTYEEEFEEDDWINDPTQQTYNTKQSYFQTLKSNGSNAQKLRRQTSNSKTKNGINNSNSNKTLKTPKKSNNNLNSFTKSNVIPSKTRGVPLGTKLSQYSTPNTFTRQLSSPNRPMIRKEEEVVGNMRYIYEIDEFGTRKCVRRLPLRKHDFQSKGHSLKD